jgi:transcription initiation factor TFIID subunit 7
MKLAQRDELKERQRMQKEGLVLNELDNAEEDVQREAGAGGDGDDLFGSDTEPMDLT